MVKQTCRVLVTGRVQGVGFRQSMRAAALRNDCTGYVRNRTDGSVEAVVQGTPDAVETLITWARRGPPGARVDALEVRPDTGEFLNFEIAATR